MNLFHGIYKPEEFHTIQPIWDLPNDFYLHNRRFLHGWEASYCAWFDENDSGSGSVSGSANAASGSESDPFEFEFYYQPGKLTSFDALMPSFKVRLKGPMVKGQG